MASVYFCWVPAHCGITQNEKADRAAKRGAQNANSALHFDLKLDVHEGYSLLKKIFQDRASAIYSNYMPHLKNINLESTIIDKAKLCHLSSKLTREIVCLSHRIRLNSIKTKFSKNVQCTCGTPLSIEHIFQICPEIRKCLSDKFITHIDTTHDMNTVLNDPLLLTDLSKSLINSPIGNLL